MQKMSYADCPGPSPAISAPFTLKMSDAAGNRQKFYLLPIRIERYRFTTIKRHVKFLCKLITLVCKVSQFIVLSLWVLVK